MDRLDSMRAFQRVIDEGSFAAAARSLDISPAVVTRLVADLEDHMGTRLLHRTTRRVSLTQAGETYLARLRMILQDIDEAHSAISAHTHELPGILRILTPPAIATYAIAPIIAEFRQSYPKVELHVEVDSHDDLPFEDYDLTLMPTVETYGGEIIARKISSSEAILVCSLDYLKKRGLPRTPADLVGHELLGLRAPGHQQHVWRLIDPKNQDKTLDIEVVPSFWINHIEALLRATIDGAGITSVIADVAAPHLASGELVRVLPPWTTGSFSLYAVLPSRKFLPERTKIFMDFITTTIRERKKQAQLAYANSAY